MERFAFIIVIYYFKLIEEAKKNIFPPASVPILRNCLELYLAGYTNPGEYWIDPTGGRSLYTGVRVRCRDDGWTTILSRGQYGNPVVNMDISIVSYYIEFVRFNLKTTLIYILYIVSDLNVLGEICMDYNCAPAISLRKQRFSAGIYFLYTYFLFQDYFDRLWADFVDGFGDPEKEHWVGLNRIYQ